MLKTTKDICLKPLGITLLSILFLITIIFVKYKPVYTVTVAGKTLGYVKEKEDLEKRLSEYINHKEGNIALISISNMPQYSFEMVERKIKTSENEILEKIESQAVITYRTYAITVNGESINEVKTEIEAEDIVSNLQADLKEGVEFELGIVEVLKTEQTSVDSSTALEQLNEIKLAKTTAYEEEQARIEREKQEKENAKLEAEQRKADEKAQKAEEKLRKEAEKEAEKNRKKTLSYKLEKQAGRTANAALNSLGRKVVNELFKTIFKK